MFPHGRFPKEMAMVEAFPVFLLSEFRPTVVNNCALFDLFHKWSPLTCSALPSYTANSYSSILIFHPCLVRMPHITNSTTYSPLSFLLHPNHIHTKPLMQILLYTHQTTHAHSQYSPHLIMPCTLQLGKYTIMQSI